MNNVHESAVKQEATARFVPKKLVVISNDIFAPDSIQLQLCIINDVKK